MQRLATLSLLVSLLAACGSNPLDDIKSAKIEGHNITWAAAAEKMSVCKQGTQQWTLQAEREKNETVEFECDLTENAIAPYNDKLEENARVNATWPEDKIVPKITDTKFLLQITHWQDTDDGLMNEFEPKITIQYSMPNEENEHLRTGKRYINDKQLVERIIAKNENPIEQILPWDPMRKKGK